MPYASRESWLSMNTIPLRIVSEWGGRKMLGGKCREDSRGIKWAGHPNRIVNIMLSDFLKLLVF